MDEPMKQIQQSLVEIEIEAEKLLLARSQLVENDRMRNGNREALTALRKRARTTKTSVPSPFESLMKEIDGIGSRPLVKEVCSTCGNHDSKEKTWMMFPGTDVFARIPFHAAHTILEKVGFYLNLAIYYKHTTLAIEGNAEIKRGLRKAINKLVPNEDENDGMFDKLADVREVKGDFGDPRAIKRRETLQPYQTDLDFDSKKLQSVVKEKTFWISEKGVMADKINPGVLRSLVTLTDKSK